MLSFLKKLTDKMINVVKTFLVHFITSNIRCLYSEIISLTTSFANVLLVFDTIFSVAWTPVGP
jgi:hypothetical protein